MGTLNKVTCKKLIKGIVFLILILLCLSDCTKSDFDKQEQVSEFTSFLDNRIPDLMKRYDIPGANVALIHDGEIVWLRAYGYADVGRKQTMTKGTTYRAESLSKSVTAWGVVKLVEQGKLDFDAPVKQYIKSWELPAGVEETITVRQLLSNSAGMPLGTIGEEYSPKGQIPSLQEYLSKEAKQIQKPGSFLYSNVGYNLLELMIEEVTGQKFAEYMDEEILGPLGMQNSSFVWKEENEDNLATGYDIKGHPVPAYVYPGKASGGLFTTADDVARFVIAGMPQFDKTNQKLLKVSNMQEIYSPYVEIPGLYGIVADSYGMGHFLETLENGDKAVFHGGQGHGWMTHFHYLPDKGDGIVILTNSQRSWPFISYLISDWSKWIGIPALGMNRIAQGVLLVWSVILLLFIASLLLLWRIGTNFMSGNRKWVPFTKENRLLRFLLGFVALAILTILVWCVNQDYLFITSVFPTAYQWLGLSALVFAVTCMLLAVFPRLSMKVMKIK
jgi:CubicO group peptidase (beta-lactamase class C family)